MCDYEEIPMKSTDDFYTYNETQEELSPGDIDGYDDEQDPWGFDPFGPDAEVWRGLDEM